MKRFDSHKLLKRISAKERLRIGTPNENTGTSEITHAIGYPASEVYELRSTLQTVL